MFRNMDTLWDLEMDTGAPFLAPVLEDLSKCLRSPRKAERDALREMNSDHSIRANTVKNFFTRTCCDNRKEQEKRETSFFKEEFRCFEKICHSHNTYCCYDAKWDKYKSVIGTAWPNIREY